MIDIDFNDINMLIKAHGM